MIHATIQYTQTDKSRNCFDLSKDSWLYFCISLEAAAICDEGLATKSQSYKGEGLGRLRSQLGTLFPKFPVSLRPPDNLCKAKDGLRQRKKQ